MAAVTQNSPSSTPCAQWGRRLSDAIREALETGDLAEARRLTLEGDGQSRGLAKEYALMLKGLCITVGVLMEQVLEVAGSDGARAEAAARVLRGFCHELSQSISAAWGGALPGGNEAQSLKDVVAATSSMLDAVQQQFDSEHAHIAAAIVAAIESHESESAALLLNRKEAEMYMPLHDNLIRFMADVFTWALRNLGNDGLLAFHLATAQAMRSGFERWEHMSPREFAWTTAFLLKQHMGEVRVIEAPERFTFEQHLCGSGGRLRREGAYERGPNPLPFVSTPGPLTFGQPSLPVYCSHCPVWNGVAPLRWFGHPHWVFENPARADGGCTLHLYKKPQEVPDSYIQMLGARTLE